MLTIRRQHSSNGWAQHTYLYWYPGDKVWPALLPVGWYISTELGGPTPLAYLPERIAVPTEHSAAWEIIDTRDPAAVFYIADTATVTSCGHGPTSRVTDYHQTIEEIERVNHWYTPENASITACLLYSEELQDCMQYEPEPVDSP